MRPPFLSSAEAYLSERGAEGRSNIDRRLFVKKRGGGEAGFAHWQ